EMIGHGVGAVPAHSRWAVVGKRGLAMIIQELTRSECLDLLRRARLGRLACARDNQPYIVPMYFAYALDYVSGFSTVGQKIEGMRGSGGGWGEVEEGNGPQHWSSVVVLGRYEELTDTPEWADERGRAHALLKRHPVWWEPGYARTVVHGSERPLEP